MNFNALDLKSLTATCYAYSCVAGKEIDLFTPKTKTPHKIVITEVGDVNGDGRIDLADVEWLIKNDKNVLTKLKGDGDFRSAECVELLKQADIVVTNPPFSLFREYMAQLMEHGKQFLIIGNMNAVTYKEIFALIKENKVWLGNKAGHFWFKVPDSYEEKATDFKMDENGQKWRRMGNICWFTNLDIEKRHEEMTLFRRYSPEEYPKYDNYDAIEVARTADIPKDWDGDIGVPITYMAQYNPDQFELIGFWNTGNAGETLGAKYCKALSRGKEIVWNGPTVNGKTTYFRIIIRRKQ